MLSTRLISGQSIRKFLMYIIRDLTTLGSCPEFLFNFQVSISNLPKGEKHHTFLDRYSISITTYNSNQNTHNSLIHREIPGSSLSQSSLIASWLVATERQGARTLLGYSNLPLVISFDYFYWGKQVVVLKGMSVAEVKIVVGIHFYQFKFSLVQIYTCIDKIGKSVDC